MSYIYALVDPRTELIRYIGKTKNIEYRLWRHLRDRDFSGSSSHKANWLRSLLVEGLDPEIFILEEVTEENWQEREKWWIAYCRARGLDLLNLTEGGEGGGGLRSEETRRRISKAWKGKKRGPQSEEHKQKSSEAHKGKKLTEEHKRRIGKASKGRKHSKRTRERISQVQRGRRHSEETKRKISIACKRGWARKKRGGVA